MPDTSNVNLRMFIQSAFARYC